jgi:hypothetical protein
MNTLPVVHQHKACSGMETQLAELLLDGGPAPEPLRAHLAACAGCQAELESLRATMQLLDSWEAPAPNPFFMTRMEARLREERAAAPANLLVRFWRNLHDRAVYGSRAGVRPLAAMAMSMMLLLGGGAYLGITDLNQEKSPSPQAAVVHDLQTMDSNAQLLDQLDAMDSNDDDSVTN